MAEACPCATCDSCDFVAELAREHASRLAAIARREGIAPADALDVVQEAFRTLLTRPDVGDLRTRRDDTARLLTVVTRNAARNLRRRHHHARPHLEVDDVPLTTREPTPGDQLERAEVHAQLDSCLAELGETHRRVVRLRVLEELSGTEVAEALGLTAGNVAVLLHRAKKQLEQCMCET